jgi:RNA polymerase sigma-70 factor (sigma-E family)
VSASRDAEFTEFVSASEAWLRRLAFMLCHDWHSADDLVQATVTRLYVRWHRAAAADNLDGYVRTMLVREFLHQRRSSWSRRVQVTDEVPSRPAHVSDQDAAIDLETALAQLPPRQRAVLVLRYHCDLSVEQSAALLACSQGNVKSQTARALAALRRSLESGPSATNRSREEMTDRA